MLHLGLLVVHPLPPGEEGVHQHHHQEDQGRGLVPPLHARTEHRLNHIQGGCPRARQKVGLPQQGYLRVLNNSFLLAHTHSCYYYYNS